MIDAWQVMDDWCLERGHRLVDRTNPHIAKGGSLNDPEFRRLLGQHQAFLAMRSFIHGSRNAQADTRPKGGDGTEIAAPFTSGPVGEADAPTT